MAAWRGWQRYVTPRDLTRTPQAEPDRGAKCASVGQSFATRHLRAVPYAPNVHSDAAVSWPGERFELTCGGPRKRLPRRGTRCKRDLIMPCCFEVMGHNAGLNLGDARVMAGERAYRRPTPRSG